MAVGFALAISALLAPPSAVPVNGVLPLHCGIQADYECVYLSIAGDGTGTVTFTSFTLGGTTTTLSYAACLRQGGTTSGTCTLGFGYLGSSATSVEVDMHVAFTDSSSCFSFKSEACGGVFDVDQTLPIQASVTDSDFAFQLTSPEVMHVHLQGTGTGTVVSTPRGISCPGTCSADFAAGSSVKLTATPATGDTFGGFGGPSCLGTLGGTSCSWVVNGTLDIDAAFGVPATPPPTAKPTATPKATAHPTPTPHATGSPQPGATLATTQAPATGTTPPTEEASQTSSPEAAASPSENPSLAPIATPSTSPVSSSGGDGSLILIPIAVAVLAVGGYLLVERLRRT